MNIYLTDNIKIALLYCPWMQFRTSAFYLMFFHLSGTVIICIGNKKRPVSFDSTRKKRELFLIKIFCKIRWKRNDSTLRLVELILIYGNSNIKVCYRSCMVTICIRGSKLQDELNKWSAFFSSSMFWVPVTLTLFCGNSKLISTFILVFVIATSEW